MILSEISPRSSFENPPLIPFLCKYFKAFFRKDLFESFPWIFLNTFSQEDPSKASPRISVENLPLVFWKVPLVVFLKITGIQSENHAWLLSEILSMLPVESHKFVISSVISLGIYLENLSRIPSEIPPKFLQKNLWHFLLRMFARIGNFYKNSTGILFQKIFMDFFGNISRDAFSISTVWRGRPLPP